MHFRLGSLIIVAAPHFLRRCPNMNRYRTLFLFGLALSVAALGCGGSSEKLLPVKGKVVQGGKAFTKGGTVVFHPDKKKGNEAPHEPMGDLSESGDYTLKTRDREGAPAGWYKVTISSHAPLPKDSYDIPKSYVNKMFTAIETSPINIEVKEGQAPIEYEIKLP